MDIREKLKECKNFKDANYIVFGKPYKNGRDKQKLILRCFEEYDIDIESVIENNKHPEQYCLKCGKKIIPKRQGERKFCSLSCAVSYNNSKREKRKKETDVHKIRIKPTKKYPRTKEGIIEKYGKEKYEEMLQKGKVYYAKNKERIKEVKRKYREINIDKYKIYQKEYQPEYRKQYNDTMEGRAKKLANTYKCRDKKKGRENDITGDFIENEIFTQPCVYCGETDFRALGCDRIDNSRGHLKDNVVCACRQCNCEREYFKKSVDEFKKYKKILLISEEIADELES